MKILCSLSGIEFECSHFPGTFYSKEAYHPVFNLPQKRLLSYTKRWGASELTNTDSYLLFLSLLYSSEQVEFRVPVFRTDKTDAIVANNMEFLVRTVIKINTVVNPAVVFPTFVISSDTRNLENVFHWIECWNDSYQDFLDGYKSAHDSSKLIKREAALQRMIKNPHKAVSEYAGQLADWAATAGNFPSFLMKSPVSGLPIPLGEYWKSIIHKATRNEYLYSIPAKDLKELLDHCEDHIPYGSIYSSTLFKVLRSASEKQNNFLGIGSDDLKSTYAILEESSTAEAANLKALVDSAPEERPKQEQYATKFEFLRAKLRWDMAQKFKPGT